MKNKILGGIVVLAIATLAAVNVALSSQSGTSCSISLAKVEEALAWEWNNPLDWFSYGLRADERTNSTPCSQTTNNSESGTANANMNSPTGNANVTINYESSSTTNVPNGNRKTCESGGNENCDPCDCC
jgi:hypothetical protein